MAVTLPPVPISPIEESFFWRDWFVKLRASSYTQGGVPLLNSIQGPPGFPGEDGQDGLDGISIQGTQGIQGIQGTHGLIGMDGEEGLEGISIQGSQGSTGIQGIPGSTGLDGEDGLDGLFIQRPREIQGAFYSYQTPATGFNITIPYAINNLVLNPAGTLATGTIVMPASPLDGQIIVVSTSQIITALTVSPNSGQTLLNAPTTLQLWANTAGAISGYGFSYIYIFSITTWVRIT